MPLEWTERLQWRKAPPIEPGYYWYVELDGDSIELYQWCRAIDDEQLYVPGWGLPDGDQRHPYDLAGWWCGPITPTPFTVEDVEQYYRQFLGVKDAR